MFADRLRKLSFHLRNEVRDEVFHLATWVGNDEVPWGGLDDLSCGTTACAMGWATTIPEFKQLGLGLVQTSHNGQGSLVFGEFKHFEAAAKFLDISEKEAEFLFNPDKYPDQEDTTRLAVCNRIDQFINYGGIYDDDCYDDEDDDDYGEEEDGEDED